MIADFAIGFAIGAGTVFVIAAGVVLFALAGWMSGGSH